MSAKRRLLGALVVGFTAAGLSACVGPGSDWPKDSPATTGSGPTRGEQDSSAPDAGWLDAGRIDAGVDSPACPESDGGAPQVTLSDAAASRDAASAVTPDSGCP